MPTASPLNSKWRVDAPMQSFSEWSDMKCASSQFINGLTCPNRLFLASQLLPLPLIESDIYFYCHISHNQSDPTTLTRNVNLGLYRHTYACATRVIQAYICLCNSGYTGICMPVRLGLDRHTYFNQSVARIISSLVEVCMPV